MQVLTDAILTSLCWGDPQGACLSVGARHEAGVPPIRTPQAALQMLNSSHMFWHWERVHDRTCITAVTDNRTYFISFICSRPERALAELREIEAQEGGLPYQLVLPVVATIKSRAQVNAAPHSYRLFDTTGELSHPEPALAAQEIRQAAGRLLVALLSTPDDTEDFTLSVLPGSAVNLALVWYAACAQLWEPELLRRASALNPAPYIPRNILLQGMALAYGRAAALSSCTFAGQQLRCSAGRVPRGAWLQLLELAAGAIPAEALRYLCDGQLPVGLPTLPLARPPATLPAMHQTTFLNGYDMFPFADSPLAPDLAASLCRALLAELAERGESYVPTGGCRIQLPENGVLNAWGITELRVWLTPDGLWCALPAADQWPGVVFEWQPGRPLRRWVVSDAVAPTLEVVLTALWRDLRVEGDTVVPTRNRRPAAARPTQEPAHRPPVRTLPRKRYCSLSGERAWGTPEERARIQRAAHAVAGHRRRLLPGARASAAALQRAAEYAFLVPQGYTFVRPYIAGLVGEAPGTAAAQAPVIRARGLATVATWLRA